jgi:hypothetical protein
MAWPIIIFHMVGLMMEALRGVGGRSRISGVGKSVERERAARESLGYDVSKQLLKIEGVSERLT